jgi:flagellar biosynthesis/type III secretory pathway M-ring protein FliF/YscJ
MDNLEFLTYYKIFRLAVLVAALYFIIWFLYFTKRGKKSEELAKRVLEEDD